MFGLLRNRYGSHRHHIEDYFTVLFSVFACRTYHKSVVRMARQTKKTNKNQEINFLDFLPALATQRCCFVGGGTQILCSSCHPFVNQTDILAQLNGLSNVNNTEMH